MMRAIYYLEDSVGLICKPVSFPLLGNAVSMFLMSDVVEPDQLESWEKQVAVKSENTPVLKG